MSIYFKCINVSKIASEKVGCGWIESKIFSTDKLFLIARLNSEIISVALEPIIWAPKMRLSFETNILINPSVELLATALPFALKNDFATL